MPLPANMLRISRFSWKFFSMKKLFRKIVTINEAVSTEYDRNISSVNCLKKQTHILCKKNCCKLLGNYYSSSVAVFFFFVYCFRKIVIQRGKKPINRVTHHLLHFYYILCTRPYRHNRIVINVNWCVVER